MSEVTRDAAEPLFGSLTKFALGSVGSKNLMAITGMGLCLFLFAHLAGNLTIYLGRDTFNHYATALHQTPALLWLIRVASLWACRCTSSPRRAPPLLNQELGRWPTRPVTRPRPGCRTRR